MSTRYVVHFAHGLAQPLSVGPFTSEARAYEVFDLLRHVDGLTEVAVEELVPFKDVKSFYAPKSP